ncbi:phosphatidic acid phosphatase [Plantibacter sp. ME-Dv--P-095]|uniref:phosphatidic acid phosphatase n=1 Tax=Plantibacter sp. ME-Dv--P-095 TaxID=3040299 RepID=UPI00254CAA45|nr:phosphatidic acid phosphatase [Plantibacter sp. ME-Dv--P-095]
MRPAPRPTGSLRVAQVVSEVFGPAPLLTFALIQAGVGTAPRGIWTALLASLLIAVLPYAALILLARSGRVSGRFVSDRRQRGPILACVLVSVVLGVSLLVWLGADARLLAVGIAAIIGLLVVTAVNLAWKLSIHAAIAAFVAILQFGSLPVALAATLLLVPLVVGWARVREGAHTTAQVIAGFGAGGAVFLAYLPILAALQG